MIFIIKKTFFLDAILLTLTILTMNGCNISINTNEMKKSETKNSEIENEKNQNLDNTNKKISNEKELHEQAPQEQLHAHENENENENKEKTKEDLLNLYYTLGQQFAKEKKYESAIENIEKSVKLDPQNHSRIRYLHDLYLSHELNLLLIDKKYAEAIIVVNKLKESKPRSPDKIIKLKNFYKREIRKLNDPKDYSSRILLYRECIRLCPDSNDDKNEFASFLIKYGSSLTETETNPQLVIDYYIEASMLLPDNAEIQNNISSLFTNYGLILEKKAYQELEIKCYENAYKLCPINKYTISNLASAYYDFGVSCDDKNLYGASIYYYAKSLTIDPNLKNALDAINAFCAISPENKSIFELLELDEDSHIEIEKGTLEALALLPKNQNLMNLLITIRLRIEDKCFSKKKEKSIEKETLTSSDSLMNENLSKEHLNNAVCLYREGNNDRAIDEYKLYWTISSTDPMPSTENIIESIQAIIRKKERKKKTNCKKKEKNKIQKDKFEDNVSEVSLGEYNDQVYELIEEKYEQKPEEPKNLFVKKTTVNTNESAKSNFSSAIIKKSNNLTKLEEDENKDKRKKSKAKNLETFENLLKRRYAAEDSLSTYLSTEKERKETRLSIISKTGNQDLNELINDGAKIKKTKNGSLLKLTNGIILSRHRNHGASLEKFDHFKYNIALNKQ